MLASDYCFFKPSTPAISQRAWLLEIDFISDDVCVSPSLRPVIISSKIWSPCDWLNKFYSFHMAAIVDIISIGMALTHTLWLKPTGKDLCASNVICVGFRPKSVNERVSLTDLVCFLIEEPWDLYSESGNSYAIEESLSSSLSPGL